MHVPSSMTYDMMNNKYFSLKLMAWNINLLLSNRNNYYILTWPFVFCDCKKWTYSLDIPAGELSNGSIKDAGSTVQTVGVDRARGSSQNFGVIHCWKKILLIKKLKFWVNLTTTNTYAWQPWEEMTLRSRFFLKRFFFFSCGMSLDCAG